MKTFMSTDEVIKDLNISESTLKNWEKQFRIKKNRGPGNKKRYNEEAMATLRMVKALRDQDRGFDTIQRVLKERNEDQITATETPTENKPVVADSQALTVNDKQEIMSSVVQVIQDQNELSEKYARATYSIGQLEAEKQALQDKLDSDKATLFEKYNLEKEAFEKQTAIEKSALEDLLKVEKEAMQAQLAVEKKYLEQQIQELKAKIETQETLLGRLKKHWFIRLFWVE